MIFGKRHTSRGVSLIELIIASALSLLVLGLVWSLVKLGGEFYLRVRSQSDIQRSTLLALRWLSKDLAQGNPVSFRGWQYNTDVDPDRPGSGYPDPPAGNYVGIAFGSPLDQNGQIEYDTSGTLKWKTVVGYYIDANPGTLYRVQFPLPDSLQFAPPTINSADHAPEVMDGVAQKRTVADHIYNLYTVQGPKNLQVFLHARHEALRFGLRVQTRLEMKN